MGGGGRCHREKKKIENRRRNKKLRAERRRSDKVKVVDDDCEGDFSGGGDFRDLGSKMKELMRKVVEPAKISGRSGKANVVENESGCSRDFSSPPVNVLEDYDIESDCSGDLSLPEDDEGDRDRALLLRDLFLLRGPKDLIEDCMESFQPQLEKIQQQSMKLWDRLEARVIGPASPQWRHLWWTMDLVPQARQLLKENPNYQLWKHPEYQYLMMARIRGRNPLKHPYRSLRLCINPDNGLPIQSDVVVFSRSIEHDQALVRFQHLLVSHLGGEMASSYSYLLERAQEIAGPFNQTLDENLRLTDEDLTVAAEDYAKSVRDTKLRDRAHQVLLGCLQGGYRPAYWVARAYNDYNLDAFLQDLRNLDHERAEERINAYHGRKCIELSVSAIRLTRAWYLRLKLHYARIFGFCS